MFLTDFMKPFKIAIHKTSDIYKLLNPNEKTDLIISMNISKKILKKIASKKETICFYISAKGSINEYVKEAYQINSAHFKIYRTENKIIFSTANLSLSGFNEISFIFERDAELDAFIEKIIFELIKENKFVKTLKNSKL